MEDQPEFVRWWKETVNPNKGGDRKKGEKRGSALFDFADLQNRLSLEEAERRTDFKS